jgi:hypothetical protein
MVAAKENKAINTVKNGGSLLTNSASTAGEMGIRAAAIKFWSPVLLKAQNLLASWTKFWRVDHNEGNDPFRIEDRRFSAGLMIPHDNVTQLFVGFQVLDVV